MPASRWLPRTVVLLAAGLVAAVGLVGLSSGAALATETDTAAPQTPPGIPSSLSVTPGDGNAVVTWVAPADDGGDTISGYTVTASPGGATAEVPGVARTATVLGLTDGMAYRFAVKARNSAGWGPESAVSQAVTPTAAAGVTGPRLIDEDFATSAADFTPVAGGTWSVASGRYVLSAPADGGEGVSNANLSVDDTVVVGDFTLTAVAATTPTDSAFNDLSVIFGFRDEADYWFASFSEGNDANTSGIFRVAHGVRTQLADITTPIVAGTLYPVRIERQGAAIRVFRSGEPMASVTDPTLQDGRVGFGSRNDGATFDDLVVTAPPPPPPPPAPPQGVLARLWERITALFT